MDSTSARVEQALDLRVKGKSFPAIAEALGYERPLTARQAFIRALRNRPEAVRADLRRQGNGSHRCHDRRIPSQQHVDAEEIARRLRALGRLREMLLAY
jgi:hypothetical protein